MARLAYLNFDLAIDAVGVAEAPFYRARVLESPAGQAEGAFDRPFSDLELESFYANVTRLRPARRGTSTRELDIAQRTGARLFEAVFTPEIYGTFRASLNDALRQGKGLRIRLRINASELVVKQARQDEGNRRPGNLHA